MAFTGRPALEAVDENTGLDAWAAKALDGLALTPTPAVQQEVSQDPFTGSRKDAESPTRQAAQAGLYLNRFARRRLVKLNGELIQTGLVATCVRILIAPSQLR